MRKLILLLAVCSLLGCKDRFDTIGTVPTSPSVKIFYLNSLKKFHRDSVKISSPNYNYFGVDLRLSDSDRYYTSLTYKYVTGSGNLVYRSDTLRSNLLPFDAYRCLVRFSPTGEGLTRISFTVTDQLNNQSEAALELLTFTNLLPVSSLLVMPIKSLDPLEYLIDASASYDADRHYGGGIVQYIYQVDGQTIATSKSQIKHIFSSRGVYTITVQTKDNDGGLSPLVTQQVSIN